MAHCKKYTFGCLYSLTTGVVYNIRCNEMISMLINGSSVAEIGGEFMGFK